MQDLGALVRAHRKEANMTMAELARRAGFSLSYLSQVERNQTNPSVSALKRIADALGISMASLFEDGAGDRTDGDAVQVVRKGNRKALVYPGSDIRYELLSPDLKRKLEFLWLTAPPGTSSGEGFCHEGEECAIVLSGSLEFWVGQERYLLKTGDSIYYPSTIVHGWSNTGTEDAQVIWAKTPPSF